MTIDLLLSAGRGPEECAWALARLLPRLEADAARHGVTTERLHTVPGDRPGTYRSVLVRLSGPDEAEKRHQARGPHQARGRQRAEGGYRTEGHDAVEEPDAVEAFAAAWTGTLCWQAPSPYRARAGRKNWYVIAQPCQVDSPRTTFDETDVDIVPCRTGGPGGQNRNKVSTAVRATHRPTGIVVVVDTERHFGLNRAAALQLLRHRIEAGDEAAAQAVIAARWRIHDDLVRGDPVRVERP